MEDFNDDRGDGHGPRVLDVLPARRFRKGKPYKQPKLKPPVDETPGLAETRHPAWGAFERLIRDGERGKEGKSQPVIRADLLECPRRYWGFVWDVFRAGYEAGKG